MTIYSLLMEKLTVAEMLDYSMGDLWVISVRAKGKLAYYVHTKFSENCRLIFQNGDVDFQDISNIESVIGPISFDDSKRFII